MIKYVITVPFAMTIEQVDGLLTGLKRATESDKDEVVVLSHGVTLTTLQEPIKRASQLVGFGDARDRNAKLNASLTSIAAAKLPPSPPLQ